jgi:hypothetical protein
MVSNRWGTRSGGHHVVTDSDYNPAEEMESSDFTIGFEEGLPPVVSEVTSSIGAGPTLVQTRANREFCAL